MRCSREVTTAGSSLLSSPAGGRPPGLHCGDGGSEQGPPTLRATLFEKSTEARAGVPKLAEQEDGWLPHWKCNQTARGRLPPSPEDVVPPNLLTTSSDVATSFPNGQAVRVRARYPGLSSETD